LANFVGGWIVENIVVLEKRQSSDNESKSAFIKSTLFKVTNFILVLWIVNRESEEWFKAGGEAIGIAVMFSILASLLPQLLGWLWVELRRFVDRGCSNKLKRKSRHNDINRDVHTFKKIQSQLNQIYTGSKINGHHVYSWLATMVFVCFSLGGVMT
jgi:hypothetical protein